MQHRAIAPPVPAHSGLAPAGAISRKPLPTYSFYSPEERARRDASPWTLVQGVLAPIQFLVFLISLALVVRYLTTGLGFEIAKQSVVAKTIVLYLIMITGSIWEKAVFGQYLFAPPFWWEDFVSMGVIALHTIYLAIAYYNLAPPAEQFAVALAAYAAYVINAAQFLHKLRIARLDPASTTIRSAEFRRATS